MRKWINASSIGLAVIITLAIPTTLFFTGYQITSGELSLEARLNAERIAHYALEHQRHERLNAWQKEPTHFARYMWPDDSQENPVRQRIYGSDGKLAFENNAMLRGPVIARTVPIPVRDKTAGSIEVATSLRDLLYRTGLAGIFSTYLGIVCYLVLRGLLLRQNVKTLQELQDAQNRLAEQDEMLRLKEAQYSNALDIARAGDWEFDPLNNTFVCTDSFYSIFGLKAEDLGGYILSPADCARLFVHPDDPPVVGAAVMAAIKTDDPNYKRELEHRMLYANGETGYVAVRFVIVKDENGRTIKVYGVNQDITRRKQIELAVTESEAKVQAALTNMSQGLCMFDSQKKLVLSNQRFAEIYQLEPEDIRPGMTPTELMELRANCFDNAERESILYQESERFDHCGNCSFIETLVDGRSITVSCSPTRESGFVVTFEDITERLAAEEKIRYLAHHDSLTDLPNRVTFMEQLEHAVNHLKPPDMIAVMSLDLDRFKSINDTLGHPAGDLLLQLVGERMRACVREEDIVARLGGDEFAIVQLSCKNTSEMTSLAGRLIKTMNVPFNLNGHHVSVGVSIGIAVAPSDGDEPETLMKNADLALYRAKFDGKGVYRFFEASMDARMRERRRLELDIQKAIKNNEFELFYQPISDVNSHEIKSCETLIRWRSPERGMISPAEFIPVAEETGLIVQIGEWVLREACKEAIRWPNHILIAVNLSPVQFKSAALLDTVADALSSSGLPAHRLELEITEGVFIQDQKRAFELLREFQKMGIKIAMDDFGTGYSSLGTLRSFPFDKIKIDKSFIEDLPEKEDGLAIVRAVVGLGSSLHMRTTAEGVETSEQLKILVEEGCDEVQGYLFSPPRPAGEVRQLLNKHQPHARAAS